MINVYKTTDDGVSSSYVTPPRVFSTNECFWIDLFKPEAWEIELIEKLCSIELPTKDEMREIEDTSRFYCEDGGRFMTASLLARMDTDAPQASEITFVLKGNLLITIRHEESKAFTMFSNQIMRSPSPSRDEAFVGLLEALVDRQGDVLERFGRELDILSKKVFGARVGKGNAPSTEILRDVVGILGRWGDLIAYQRNSFVSLNRVISYASNEANTTGTPLSARLSPVSRDVNSLSEYASFLSNKINFMLDAVLGLINIDQNEIFKVFTIMGLVFLPPTLIASVFGMNFHHLPFLAHPWAGNVIFVVIALAAILPLVFFKIKQYI